MNIERMEEPTAPCEKCQQRILRFRWWKPFLFQCACSDYTFNPETNSWLIKDRHLFFGRPRGRQNRAFVYIARDDHYGKLYYEVIPLARLMMECWLGRALSEDEVVHHKDHDPTNDVLENFAVMTKSEHQKYHAQARREEKLRQAAGV